MSSSTAGGSFTHHSNGNGNGVGKAKRVISESSDEEDIPLAKKARPSTISNGSAIKDEDDSSEDEAPLAARSAKPRPSIVAKEEDDDSSDSDVPLGQSSSSPPKKGIKRESPESDEDSDVPLGESQRSNGSKNGAKQADSDDDDEEEEEDDEDDDDDEDDEDDGESSKGKKKGKAGKIELTGTGGVKWTTLYHTGPRFPPAHDPLPKNIKMKYEGRPVDLLPEAEEAAYFYAIKLETQHARDKVFNSNFFDDFKSVLKQYPPRDGTKIKEFSKCDFQDMYAYFRTIKDEEAAKKKLMAPSQRKKLLEEKKKAEAEMKTCVVDGVEQRVGNVIVEPPALFLGRGEHPKKGRIKRRVPPEAITINHTLGDPNHPPPAPPAGHKWKEVREDRTTTWLAYWIENINGQYKYMYLDATSGFKSNSDREKFEKARRLDKVVDRLRSNIDKMIVSKQRQERQLGTVIWLIDNYSLRAGNEKGDDEAATYGVCSLLVEHVKALNDDRHQVKLEFLGKDSMKFKETLNVPERIFKNFKMFTQSTRNVKGDLAVKSKTDEIFDKVDTKDVNKFLQDPSNGGQKGLSAKVFRTYNASTTFQGLLNQTEQNLKAAGLTPTPQILRDQYNQANRLVAILCNHQKTVNPVQSDKAAARFEERMLAVKYERFKERQKLLTHYKPKDLKAQYPAKEHDFAKRWSEILAEIDITKDQIREHEERMITNKKDRIQMTFDRAELERKYLAEQAKAEGKKKKVKKEEAVEETNSKKPKTQAEVNAEKKKLTEELDLLKRERKANKSEASSVNVPSCAKKILTKIAQEEKLLAENETKNKTSDVSLGTSKLNYIDPRITVAWLKKWDAKLAKMEGIDSKGKKTKVKKEEPPSPAGKGRKSVSVKDEKTNKTADSDRMELDLKVIPIGHYFPMTMQKKFKWAAQEEDGSDLSPNWVFVEKAESKIRDNMSSARRKGGAAADSDGEDEEEKNDRAEAQKAIAAAKVNSSKTK
ncbi:uncharacterized protein FA14DRAFT_116931 [Meira miltonrushii]|uniref:DNA topoisomerase 1 n=1 Tax=Meira miltonrushii TaxID=1280837 RepID=A0A316VNB8_9BASI|nr:uncharacterized protein FA14DRAFT_116931 [Meira miltonrushii]PWN37055.1 hypothetical protein FA14DRAFT_116931 [Meira miltonrushii]